MEYFLWKYFKYSILLIWVYFQKSEKHDDEPIEDMSEEQMREREIEKLRALVKVNILFICNFGGNVSKMLI